MGGILKPHYMDFLNPNKKRAHLRRLYVGYALMAVALITGTFVLAFAAYGYDIDRKTGGIIQNGLISLDAHPESADILINNTMRGTTADGLVLPAGDYNVTLRRNNYRDWSHQVALEGSTIERLVYPFLFPTELSTRSLQQYSAVPTLISESPDKRSLLLQLPGASSVFNVVDLSNSKNAVSTISLPEAVITVADGDNAYEAIEWSSNNTHLLFKHSFNGKQEFILLDKNNPVNSLNLTKHFADQDFSAVSMRDKKADQFYLFSASAGTLNTAELGTKTVTPLLTHVLQYKTYQADTIAYIATPSNVSPTGTDMAELHIRQNNQDQAIRNVPASDNYLLDMAQFDGNFYVVAGSGKDGRSYVYKNPFSDLKHRPLRLPQPFRVLIVPAAQYVSFSGNARFIAVQQANNFAVLDLETDRQFRYKTPIDVPVSQKATWMDGHRLIVNSGGFMHAFDFDGKNLQKLVPGSVASNAFFDRDYTAMFVIAPVVNSPEKSSLTRTELKALTNPPPKF